MSKKMILVCYSSNNSGGSWWLEDSDWAALREAGWTTPPAGHYPDSSKPLDENGMPVFHDPSPGRTSEDGRWLGALHTYAYGYFPSIEHAMLSFRDATGQDPEEEGCPCCGPPHSFSEESTDRYPAKQETP